LEEAVGGSREEAVGWKRRLAEEEIEVQVQAQERAAAPELPERDNFDLLHLLEEADAMVQACSMSYRTRGRYC